MRKNITLLALVTTATAMACLEPEPTACPESDAGITDDAGQTACADTTQFIAFPDMLVNIKR